MLGWLFLTCACLTTAPALATNYPTPSTEFCDETAGEITLPGDAAASPGIWWNPQREGTGWDFHYSPWGALQLYWYTYDREHRPIWLVSDMVQPDDDDGTWESELYKITWNYTNGTTVKTDVGFVVLSFLPTDPSRVVVLWRWKYTGPGGNKTYTQTECLFNLFATATDPEPTSYTINPSFNGEWTEAIDDDGLDDWAMALVVGRDSTDRYTELETFTIFDTEGNPVWVQAQSDESADLPPTGFTTYPVGWFEAIGYGNHVPISDCNTPVEEGAADQCRVGTNVGISKRRFSTGGTTGDLRLAVDGTNLGDTTQDIKWYRPSAAAFPGDPRMAPTGGEDDITIKRVATDQIVVEVNGCRVPNGATTCDIPVSWDGRDYSGYQVFAVPIGDPIAQPELIFSAHQGRVVYALEAGSRYRFTLQHDGEVVAKTYEVRADPPGEYTGIAEPAPAPATLSPPSSVPVSSDEVGATAATFRVDEQGHPNYRIDIFAPAGSGGFQPKLALLFDGNGGDGHLGPGWHLAGLSSIRRCRRTVEFGDPEAVQGPISLTDQDAFCLDGQRLVLVSGVHAQNGAVYHPERDIRTRVRLARVNQLRTFTVQGADGVVRYYGSVSTLPVGRPAIEWKEVKRMDSVGNAVYFEYIRTNADSKSRLSEISYTGGRIALEYVDNTSGGSRLSYTAGHAYRWQGLLTAIKAYAADDASLLRKYVIGYEDIPLHTSRQRVASITECGAGGVCLSPTEFEWGEAGLGTVARDATEGQSLFDNLISYRLGDANGDGRTDVYWVDSDQWLKVSYAQPVSGDSEPGIYFGPETPFPITYFGDENIAKHGWLLNDINGDGRDDVAYLCVTASSCGNVPLGTWVVRYAGGINFSSPTPLPELGDGLRTTPRPDGSTPPDTLGNWGFLTSATMGDFNGDGVPDMLMAGIDDSNQPSFQVRFMEPVRGKQLRTFATKFLAPDTQRAISPAYAFRPYKSVSLVGESGDPCDLIWSDEDALYNSRALDFNGDGLADLLVDGSPGCLADPVPHPPPPDDPNAGVTTGEPDKFWTIFINQGPDASGQVSFWMYESWQYSGWGETVGEHSGLQFYDVNGDGLLDVLEREPSTDRWRYRLNKGTDRLGGMPSLDIAKCVDPQCDEFPTAGAHAISFMDIDGDGATDLLPLDSANSAPPGSCNGIMCRYHPYVWDGDGFREALDARSRLPYRGAGDDDGTNPWIRLFADFDGDGVLDSLSIKPQGGAWHATRYKTLNSPGALRKTLGKGRLVGITNGLAAKTRIYYAPLTLRDAYQRDFDGPWNDWGRGSAVFDVATPRSVVRLVESSAPIAGDPSNMAMVAYSYAGLKVQTGGRGSLGFRLVTSYDYQTGVRTRTHYAQAFPLTGTPLATESHYVPTDTPSLEGLYDTGFDLDSHHYWNERCARYYRSVPCPETDVAGAKTLSTSVDEWHWRELGGTAVDPVLPAGASTPLFVYRSNNTVTKFAEYDGLSGAMSKTETVFSGYDAHGNLTGSTTTVHDHGAVLQTKSSVFQYADVVDATNWWLGRLANTQVTTARPQATDSAIVRNVAFDYDDATQLLASEVVNVEGLGIRTYYQRDGFGNVTAKAVCDLGTAESTCRGLLGNPISANFHPDKERTVMRWSGSEYDALGRYVNVKRGVFETQNGSAVRDIEVVQQRDAGGNPLRVTDANGGEVRQVYGALGRAYWTGANSGASSTTTYAHCWTTSVPCPTGAVYRVTANSPGSPTSWTYFDSTARVVMVVKEGFAPASDPNSTPYVAVRQYYDAGGNKIKVSEPYASHGPFSAKVGDPRSGAVYYTTSSFDALKRIDQIVKPDGAAIYHAYQGNSTTIWLPTNKDGYTQTKEQVTNALGEIVETIDSLGTTVVHVRGTRSIKTTVTPSDDSPTVTLSTQLDALGHVIAQDNPDRGHWDYKRNALGEQIMAKSPRGTCVRQWFDGQGRVWRNAAYANATCAGSPTSAAESYVLSQYDWAYHGLGALVNRFRVDDAVGESGDDQSKKWFSYDALGRPVMTKTSMTGTSLNNPNFVQSTSYDQYGRPFQSLFAPSVYHYHKVGEQFEYGSNGYLRRTRAAYGAVGGANYGQIHREILNMNAHGQVVDERYADNAHLGIHRVFDPQTGRLTDLVAGGAGSIAKLEYGYDIIGNMSWRRDSTSAFATGGEVQNRNVYEEFHFDALQRLTSIEVDAAGEPAVRTYSTSYDATGNIDSKSGLGAYTYGGEAAACANEPGSVPAGPHAATMVGTRAHCYDAAGNEIYAPGQRRLYYDARGQVSEIQLANGQRVKLRYGPDGAVLQRVLSTYTSYAIRSTVYIGNHEIEFIGEDESSPTVRSHFGPLILTQNRRMVMDGSMRTTLEQRYRFTDVLGSTVALTDAFGAIEYAESRMGFDAWGARRDPVTGELLTAGSSQDYPVSDTTDRGYTGQRHEDGAGLVHLGARWYDPVMGRFVQADSVLGDPGGSQAYNFYSYALNNPLAYTDPSGYWGQQEQAYLRAAVAIVIAAYTGYYIGAAELTGSAAIGTAALGGAAAGAVASGNLRGAVTGAFSGMLFYGIGTAFSQANAGWAYTGQSLNTAGWAAKTVAHGFAGGIMAELEGDKFGHGFVSAGFTQSMSGVIGRVPNAGGKIVVAAVVGGTASELSGGKFANGAVTAGFARALNDELHFDGERLKWLDDDGNLVEEWPAVSGRSGSDVADQEVRDYGPIPEGEYGVQQNRLQEWDDLPLLQKIVAYVHKGQWPGATVAWGEYRVWLNPSSGTQTFGRSGFSIHGGSISGSAGCIDLTDQMDDFVQAFRHYRDDMTLTVEY